MANDVVLYELGIDIKSSFKFNNGDLQLAEYDSNLVQAIVNRLNTYLDELDLFYDNYGSVLQNFLGWRRNEQSSSFISSELETVLKSEPRLSSWDFEISYQDKGIVIIQLQLHPNENYTINTSLAITENGVEVVE